MKRKKEKGREKNEASKSRQLPTHYATVQCPESAAFKMLNLSQLGLEHEILLCGLLCGLLSVGRSHSITISSVTLKISLEAREKSPDD